MSHPVKILKEFRVTEKATLLASSLNQYTFEIYPDADKKAVKEAVESVFNVSVVRVNIVNKAVRYKSSRMRRGKQIRIPAMKKAIVTLKQGDAIDLN